MENTLEAVTDAAEVLLDALEEPADMHQPGEPGTLRVDLPRSPRGQ